MRRTTPKVYLIGRTTLDKDAVQQWLSDLGTEYKWPGDIPHTSGTQLVTLAGKRCYKSFAPRLNPNVTRVRNSATEFIDNLLKVGHGSVLEHAVYNFALENVSRVFTGEMNRHRAGMAISEGSMRYIRFDDIPFWFPPSIQGEDKRPALRPNRILQVVDMMSKLLKEEGADQEKLKQLDTLILCMTNMIEMREEDAKSLDFKKESTRHLIELSVRIIEMIYTRLVQIWADELAEDSKFKHKKAITSMLRRIIPMGVSTGGVWSGNLRALRHIFTIRCDEAAEEEILLVASLMLDLMSQAEPLVFADFAKTDGYWRPKYRKV